jgi:hypothetical protein
MELFNTHGNGWSQPSKSVSDVSLIDGGTGSPDFAARCNNSKRDSINGKNSLAHKILVPFQKLLDAMAQLFCRT